MNEIHCIQANISNLGTSVPNMITYLNALNLKELLIADNGAKLGTNLGHSISSNTHQFNLNCGRISGADLGADLGFDLGFGCGSNLGVNLGVDLDFGLDFGRLLL